MTKRLAAWWWPILAVASPVLAPMLALRNVGFKRDRKAAQELNRRITEQTRPLDLPELEYLELTVLAEWRHADGFVGEPGVSYLFRSNLGSLLLDLGFGPERGGVGPNAFKAGVAWQGIDALVISHLHMDHMGGEKAQRKLMVCPPPEMGDPGGALCFLPDQAKAPGFKAEAVTEPRLLPGGMATTGPLHRRLFFMGWCKEQALVARLKGKGLAVFTGCGHPTIEVILDVVQKMHPDPVYAVGGGLHFPLTQSRLKKPGMEAVMIFGTGKPPWQRVKEEDLAKAMHRINQAGPKKVFLSAHDTCDSALQKMKQCLHADATVLQAGETYSL